MFIYFFLYSIDHGNDKYIESFYELNPPGVPPHILEKAKKEKASKKSLRNVKWFTNVFTLFLFNTLKYF